MTRLPRDRAGERDDMWRSLDELAESEDFRRHLEAEFPSLAQLLAGDVDRRTILKAMGASLAFGGLAACDEAERIVPYVRQPENTVPGEPRFYATTLASQGFGIGAVVETHEGRPTKVEGNPDHPASLGATDAVMQAAPLGLFDPDRSRTPIRNGRPAHYDAFLLDVTRLRADRPRGRGLALLVEPGTSPSLKAQIESLRGALPEYRVYRHDPLATSGGRRATATLFGRPLACVWRFDRARTILSLDADFLGEPPGRLAHARDFAAGRRVRAPADGMSRIYAVESTPTITGAVADHRRALRPAEVERFTAALDAALGGERVPEDSPVEPSWVEALARDLRDAGPDALIVPGETQSAYVHAAALRMNARLGGLGRTVGLIEPPDALATDGDLADLVEAIRGGDVDTLFCLGPNPVHTGPAGLDVADAFGRLARLVHWGLYQDETAALAEWHLPATHELESWSDLRAFDGTASLVQPMIRPLFAGRGVHEILAALMGEFDRDPRGIVRDSWRPRLDERAWRQALRDGVVQGTAFAPVPVQPPPDLGGLAPEAPRAEGLEIRFAPDPFLRDGRHANSSWLQELPRPLTKMVWGNAALVAPATADRLGLGNEEIATVSRDGRSLDAPVWIVPGHPEDTVTLTLGHGRARAGSVAALASGYDAFRLRPADGRWHAAGASLEATGDTARVLTTQHHQAMEGRHIVRHATLDEFRADPAFVHHGLPPPPEESLYPDWDYPRQSWGMSISHNACIGCMACVAACQAENVIATVGPEECARGHEMHWLRVDRYYAGPPEDPETFFQPVPCMHCEKAPCEPVCPVNATVHTHDGLNAQVYNRCIGTRYCSQNCPYKVRRFNFLDYQPFDKAEAGPQQAMRNPDVSVRSRGVMEKCTYCVQRISAARIQAKLEDREIGDGEVVTACQQACPTGAIVFGDLNDPESAVNEAKAAPHDYALLAELNTRPRTTYLGAVRNPNPRLAKTKAGADDD